MNDEFDKRFDEKEKESVAGEFEKERVDEPEPRIKKNPLDTRARTISMIVMALMLLTIWYMLDLVLLTFIVSFCFYHLLRKLHTVTRGALKSKIPDNILLIGLYLLLIVILSVASGYFAPRLVAQITEIANIFRKFDFDTFRESLDPYIAEALLGFDLTPYISQVGSMLMTGVSRFGTFSINFLLSLMLSLFLLMEKDKIRSFGEVLSTSKISFLYEYFMNFGTNFTRSFASVMKVQLTIAFINCILSMIALSFLGFPQVLGLGIMIFLLGLIPVAGVIISLVPLSVVAFYIGGISKVIAVIIMIAIIHALEAYILNPKLMSDRMSLPISFVFVILVVAEHYLKVWGLLIGVPLFIFVLNLFEVDYKSAFVSKKTILPKLRIGRKNSKHARKRPGRRN
jgi:predicted PurR-regulated permease PerM